MKYSTVVLRERNYTALITEIMFNIATERVDGAELIRLDIPKPKNSSDTKAYPAALRIVKSIKKKGIIQLFANDESFADATTESEYLLNKYSELLAEEERSSDFDYIYVKL